MRKKIGLKGILRRYLGRMTLWGIVIFFSFVIFIELSVLLNMRNHTISTMEFRSAELPVQLKMLDKMDENKSFEEIRDFVMTSYPDEPPDRHELGHKLGEIALKEFAFNAFGFCDISFNYGCFHGVALAAVRHHGLKPRLSEDLWIGCKKNASNPGRCLHGLGHVIMMLNQYDLLASYKECERFLSEGDSFWCQDGVAMENIERRLADPAIKPYGSDTDPYYPCNAIPEKYETVCARNHLQFARNKFSLTFQESIPFCLGFKMVRSQEECISILGSLLADDFFNDSVKIIELCREARDHAAFCIKGAAHVFATAQKKEEAKKLCDTLMKETERSSCASLIHSIELE